MTGWTRRHEWGRSLLAASVAGLSVLVAGQVPQQQTPVFRGRVDLVHLDVSVLDKNRRPVRGLTKDDFIVLEDNKPQDVSIFEAVDVPGPVPPPVAWMRDVTPDVTTNEGKLSRLWLVVVDDAMIGSAITSAVYQKKMSRQSVVDVIDRFGPEDLVTIVFTADSRPAQDFTNDRTKLLATLHNYNPGWGLTPETAEQFQIGNLYTVRNAMDAMIALPHKRKAMIWISSGPYLPTGFNIRPEKAPMAGAGGGTRAFVIAEMRKIEVSKEIFEVARRANVPIYPVKPGGLDDDPGEVLRVFANESGGHAYINSNEFGPGMDQIFEENSSYYLVGYYPTNTKTDGAYRKLDVKVKREGVDVRTRSSYFAPKAGDRPPRNTNEKLSRAAAEPIPVQELPLRATAAAFAIPGNQKMAAVAITLGVKQPPEDMLPGRVRVTTDMRINAFTTEGTNKGTERQTTTVDLRGGSRGDTDYEALSRIDLPPGRFRLRVAAYHDDAARTGTVMVDVIVPDFGKDEASLSGVVLGVVPGRPSAPRDLFRDLMPLQPTVRREFAVWDIVTAFFNLHQTAAGPPAPANVAIRIRDVRDAEVISEQQVIAADRFRAGMPLTAAFQYRLPLDRLKPGPHLLTFEATVGQTVLRREIQFSVK